uniref:Uncharacterized protein n=1 Tax=Salix viminalis TaxID=40686 RepID=A0A6N2KVE6_SALVM
MHARIPSLSDVLKEKEGDPVAMDVDLDSNDDAYLFKIWFVGKEIIERLSSRGQDSLHAKHGQMLQKKGPHRDQDIMLLRPLVEAGGGQAWEKSLGHGIWKMTARGEMRELDHGLTGCSVCVLCAGHAQSLSITEI